jgi:hypothetical protein
MTWKLVRAEDVPAGPWIPKGENASSYIKHRLALSKFNKALSDSIVTGKCDLVRKLWKENVTYPCSEITYELTQDSSIEELDQLLGKKNADVNAPLAEIKPLSVAAARGNVPAIEWLLAHGAVLNPEIDGDNSWENYQPLNMAVQSEKLEAVKVLLSKGASDVHTLDYLERLSDSATSRAIVDAYAKSGRLKPTDDAFTLLMVCRSRNVYLLQTLLSCGFNPLLKFTDNHGLPYSGKDAIDAVRIEMGNAPKMKAMLALLERAGNDK